jgi:hypothetical protein
MLTVSQRNYHSTKHYEPWHSSIFIFKWLISNENKYISEYEVEVNLRPTVRWPVCPGVRRPSGTCDQFFFRHEISCRQLRLCYFVAPSLTRGRVCNLLLNCFWALPEQSLLSRSPAELTAIFMLLSVWIYRDDIVTCGRNWTRNPPATSLRTVSVKRQLLIILMQ